MNFGSQMAEIGRVGPLSPTDLRRHGDLKRQHLRK